ncbi:MAG TPA: hypothetical protein VJQ82_07460 [Terriglobales bacterium]|nr:hypothetical protein [Terriglobales bacterium]
MRTVFIFLSLGLLTGALLAQDPAPSPTPKTNGTMQVTELPAGVAMAAELSKSIDSRKAKAGDPVVAKTTQDMLSNGKIVIPHDSKITGHITEAQGRPKGQKGDATSNLGIAFDQLTLKGGQQIPLHAEIQAIAKPVQVAPSAAGEAPGGGTLAGGGYPAGGGGYPAGGSVGSPGSTSGAGPGNPPGNHPSSQPSPEDSASTPAGVISVQNQGVIGMKGFSLSSNDQGSVISSNTENVKLDGGTQLVLKTKGK